MQKLQEEVSEFFWLDYRRTIWYGYIDDFFEENLILKLAFCIIQDLDQTILESVNETHWIFYGSRPITDIIGQSIRPAIMVREKEGIFLVNHCLVDYLFASQLDHFENVKAKLESTLNQMACGVDQS